MVREHYRRRRRKTDTSNEVKPHPPVEFYDFGSPTFHRSGLACQLASDCSSISLAS